MSHISTITAAKDTKQDGAEFIFFQVFFTILGFMVSAIVGDK